jgi:RHS repeat-associated protein
VYVLDGQNVVLRFDHNLALKSRYLHGPAVDQILADEQVTSTSSAGTTYWPLTDHLGSVRQLVENTGAEPTGNWRVDYDPWGNVNSLPTSVAHIYGYTGREHDVESYFQYNRGRYYYPAIGRWSSEDPIKIRGGDENFYRYVHNQPTKYTDPDGLQARPPMNPYSPGAGPTDLDNAMFSFAVDLVPFVGAIKGAYEAGRGTDPITKNKLDATDRTLAGIGAIPIPGGKAATKVAGAGVKVGGEALALLKKLLKNGDNLADLLKQGGKVVKGALELKVTARIGKKFGKLGKAVAEVFEKLNVDELIKNKINIVRIKTECGKTITVRVEVVEAFQNLDAAKKAKVIAEIDEAEKVIEVHKTLEKNLNGIRTLPTARSGLTKAELVEEAKHLYPDLKGTQKHHIKPQYLGGPKNGDKVELDRAYHQLITNEFRDAWEYGQNDLPNAAQWERIKLSVYSMFPYE